MDRVLRLIPALNVGLLVHDQGPPVCVVPPIRAYFSFGLSQSESWVLAMLSACRVATVDLRLFVVAVLAMSAAQQMGNPRSRPGRPSRHLGAFVLQTKMGIGQAFSFLLD